MRKRDCVITDENYFEWIIPIGQSAVEYIIRGLQEKYTAKFTVRMQPNYIMDNLLTISMFFDTKINRLYINYNLDKDRTIAVKAYDTELYNRIYDNIYTLERDYDIKFSIVGKPTEYIENSRGRDFKRNGLNNLFLSNDTQYLWKIIGERSFDTSRTYFVESRNMLIDDIRKRFVNDSREYIDDKLNIIIPEDIMPDYNQDVLDINSRYDFTKGNPDYVSAFEEYQTVYYEYFNRIPEIIPEWKGFTIFVDVDHDFEKERMDYENHPYGKFINPDEVEHYIAKWAHDHDKYVPIDILRKWGLE